MWSVGLLLPALAAAQAFDDRVVVRAWFKDPASLRAIAPLLGHAQVDHAKGLLRTEADAGLRRALQAAGFDVDTDVEATLAIQRLAAAERLGMKSIPGFACYRTVEETEAAMQDLVATAPELAEILPIGSSWQAQNGSGGYTLQVLKATNRAIPGPKPAVFMVSSIHAREYTPAELGTRFVEQLIAGYGSDADATWLLDHTEVHALLQANPDGRKKAETGLSWRKNTNSNFCGSGNSAGVDLNRNFPFEWANWNGSSGSACEPTFRGPAPMSEPETQAIIAHARSIFADHREPPFNAAAPADTPGLFFDLHSYSGLVLWPWGFDEQDAPNATALAALGRRLAWFNNYTPQQAVGLYPTDGTTDDFAYGELGVAAYTMELGTAFFQDCASFENTIYPNNRDALRYALRSARAPYLLPSGPDVIDLRAEPDLVAIGDDVTIRATIDDRRQREGSFTEAGPQPPVQAIASAAMYPQSAPWQQGAIALPMLASDGAFDSSIESVIGLIDTTGLDAGRQLLWVQGHDAAGNAGPPAAAFVTAMPPSELITVIGTVRQFGTQSPLAAQIRSGVYQSSSDPQSGGYQRRLPVGSHDIEFSAPGHESQLLSGVSAAGGATVSHDVELYRLCRVLDDPVEIGAPTPLAATTPWTRRAAAGIDGGAAWMQGSSGNYGNNLNASLTSAALDLSGFEAPELNFDQRCVTEAGYDFGRVEISTNGGSSWTEVFRCDGESSWRQVRIPLPQLADVATARIRFRFSSDSNLTAAGWAVDNVALLAGGQACRDSQGGPRGEPFIDGFEASGG